MSLDDDDVVVLHERQGDDPTARAEIVSIREGNCLPLWVDQGDGGVVGSTKD